MWDGRFSALYRRHGWWSYSAQQREIGNSKMGMSLPVSLPETSWLYRCVVGGPLADTKIIGCELTPCEVWRSQKSGAAVQDQCSCRTQRGLQQVVVVHSPHPRMTASLAPGCMQFKFLSLAIMPHAARPFSTLTARSRSCIL